MLVNNIHKTRYDKIQSYNNVLKIFINKVSIIRNLQSICTICAILLYILLFTIIIVYIFHYTFYILYTLFLFLLLVIICIKLTIYIVQYQLKNYIEQYSNIIDYLNVYVQKLKNDLQTLFIKISNVNINQNNIDEIATILSFPYLTYMYNFVSYVDILKYSKYQKEYNNVSLVCFHNILHNIKYIECKYFLQIYLINNIHNDKIAKLTDNIYLRPYVSIALAKNKIFYGEFAYFFDNQRTYFELFTYNNINYNYYIDLYKNIHDKSWIVTNFNTFIKQYNVLNALCYQYSQNVNQYYEMYENTSTIIINHLLLNIQIYKHIINNQLSFFQILLFIFNHGFYKFQNIDNTYFSTNMNVKKYILLFFNKLHNAIYAKDKFNELLYPLI